MRWAPGWLGIVALAMGVALAQESGPIGPADYPELARLLRESLPEQIEVVPFEDLWQDPNGGSGRAVRVSGVARRVFRQPAVGEFPALAEVWITDEAGNPMGLMFPDRPRRDYVGQRVAFQGRVLRMVEYRGGSEIRRAPLIVGPEPPNMTLAGPIEPAESERWVSEWVLGGLLLVFVILVLGMQHARRPRRPSRPPGPRPRFEASTESEPGAADG